MGTDLDLDLTKKQMRTLARCEERIAKGMRSFVDVGRALGEIVDQVLYRCHPYGTFAAYCKQRWEITPNYAKRLIKAAQVVEAIQNGQPGDNASGSVPIGTLPVTETQARPLTTIALDSVDGVWQQTIKDAPKDDYGRPLITESLVQEAVENFKSSPPPGGGVGPKAAPKAPEVSDTCTTPDAGEPDEPDEPDELSTILWRDYLKPAVEKWHDEWEGATFTLAAAVIENKLDELRSHGP